MFVKMDKFWSPYSESSATRLPGPNFHNSVGQKIVIQCHVYLFCKHKPAEKCEKKKWNNDLIWMNSAGKEASVTMKLFCQMKWHLNVNILLCHLIASIRSMHLPHPSPNPERPLCACEDRSGAPLEVVSLSTGPFPCISEILTLA